MATTETDKDTAVLSPRSAEASGLRAGSASAEVLRLQNIIKVKDKELDDTRKEVVALKASLSAKDRALHQSEHDLRLLKERNTITEGELANMAKELAALKVDKRKLEAQLAGLVRRGDKEQPMPAILAQEKLAASAAAAAAAAAKLSNGATAVNNDDSGSTPAGDLTPGSAFATGPSASNGNPASRASGSGGGSNPVPNSEEVASLQADLRMARMDGEKAAENVKALENVLRAKDKHIAALQRKADEADAVRSKCYDFENKLLETQRQLEELRVAGRTNTEVLRGRDVDKARLMAELEKTKTALELAQDAVARSTAALKASEMRCAALESEVGTLVSQLARTSVVAQRVAVAEVKAGCKDEGVVHVTRHLEEVRFMSGEIGRLQERIATLEKELAAASGEKAPVRRQSTQGASILGSPGSPTRVGSAARRASAPGSRPSSAPRRPFTSASVASTTTIGAIAAARPSSAPRSRSALRSSTNSIPAAAAGAAAAASGAGGVARMSVLSQAPVRASFSGPMRRSSRPQPWETQSPTKTQAAGSTAAANTAISPKGGAAAGSPAAAKPSAAAAGSGKGPAARAARPGSARAVSTPSKTPSVKAKGTAAPGSAAPAGSGKSAAPAATASVQEAEPVVQDITTRQEDASVSVTAEASAFPSDGPAAAPATHEAAEATPEDAGAAAK